MLDKLREAAYAGRVKFRAQKSDEDDFKDIDPLYFQHMPEFNWWHDEIFRREDVSSPVWHFVHLDREQFVSLLEDIGVSVQQHPNDNALSSALAAA